MAKKQRMKSEGVVITTPEFRVSYPNVFKPGDLSKKYEVVAIFQVAETEKSKAAGTKVVSIEPLKELCRNVAIEKYGADRAKWPPIGDGAGKLKFPFRDGGTELTHKDKDGYGAGTIFVTIAHPTQKPGIVEAFADPVTGKPALLGAETDFYAGCYARAQVNAYFWEYMGKSGISLSLGNIQKLRDGERLGGGASAAADSFEAIAQPPAAAQGLSTVGAAASNAADPTGV